MRIHIVNPTSQGEKQIIMATEVLVQEMFSNILLSFAYRNTEKYQRELWDSLINYVKNP